MVTTPRTRRHWTLNVRTVVTARLVRKSARSVTQPDRRVRRGGLPDRNLYCSPSYKCHTRVATLKGCYTMPLWVRLEGSSLAHLTRDIMCLRSREGTTNSPMSTMLKCSGRRAPFSQASRLQRNLWQSTLTFSGFKDKRDAVVANDYNPRPWLSH